MTDSFSRFNATVKMSSSKKRNDALEFTITPCRTQKIQAMQSLIQSIAQEIVPNAPSLQTTVSSSLSYRHTKPYATPSSSLALNLHRPFLAFRINAFPVPVSQFFSLGSPSFLPCRESHRCIVTSDPSLNLFFFSWDSFS